MGCAAAAGAVNNIVTIAPARMPCALMPIITSVINYDDNYRPYPGFLGTGLTQIQYPRGK